MRIVHTDLEFRREPFARPFAFKGSAFYEKWNNVVRLRDEGGTEAFGVGGLAVLWSDPAVFAAHTEVGGNLLGASLLEYALQQARGRVFEHPADLFDDLLPKVHDYGKSVTCNPDLRLTFTLIALVALDNAAWMLYARNNGIDTFDGLVPPSCQPFLAHRQRRIVLTPTVTYGLPEDKLRATLEDGAGILKIKIGQPGDEADMLAKDIHWLTRIHELARLYETPHTDSGRVLYYLDANGRYGKKESMARLLDHARNIGMLDHIILIEEPFFAADKTDVHGLPACFAADESVQTLDDVRTRAGQGYGALTVKPAGKTLSLAFRMVEAAAGAGLPCFVADNGCVPLLVEWNKNVAARLPAFPGVKGGILESHGPETYGNWADMLSAYPVPNASWLSPRNGAFLLDEDYYRQSGGIFPDPVPYARLFR